MRSESVRIRADVADECSTGGRHCRGGEEIRPARRHQRAVGGANGKAERGCGVKRRLDLKSYRYRAALSRYIRGYWL